ncbi:MAG: hypothetical protein ISS15_03040 [Alphaproteobacteria bacterium]|nr:hypothetical protein [Alphaproteobacteria bacterium]MBL6939093.1 hypothetical protein [Alphaproteobacteria bacterium]MBL7096610.1 hypothetical protein [Alphaproteobacteria bacterium]
MGEGKSEGPSFSGLVFGRAVKDTATFLGYTRRDLIIGAIALILGAGCAYLFVGRADTMNELALIVAFTLAPAGLILFAVFIWHLWLAPSVLAYEAAQEAFKRPPVAAPVPVAMPPLRPAAPAFNFSLWKRRQTYTVFELSELLAAAGRSDTETPVKSGDALLLILEAMKLKTLKYVIEYRENYTGDRYEIAPHGDTVMNKAEAINWANANGFDTSKFE